MEGSRAGVMEDVESWPVLQGQQGHIVSWVSVKNGMG